MPFDTLNVDPETAFRVEQGGQPLVVYECKLEGVPCGMFVEGTTNAVSAHLRRHGINSPDSARISCPWGGCSKTLKRGGLTRHILTHLGVKVRCSICEVVRCRPTSFVRISDTQSCAISHLSKLSMDPMVVCLSLRVGPLPIRSN
ncbi:hypothetical protein F4604DRAFT_1787925, partial [Suillus subluteus]